MAPKSTARTKFRVPSLASPEQAWPSPGRGIHKGQFYTTSSLLPLGRHWVHLLRAAKLTRYFHRNFLGAGIGLQLLTYIHFNTLQPGQVLRANRVRRTRRAAASASQRPGISMQRLAGLSYDIVTLSCDSSKRLSQAPSRAVLRTAVCSEHLK